MKKILNKLNITTLPQAIFWDGLISGLLDATAGVIVYLIFKGLNPIQVLQYIASGIFGSSAFTGGIPMALVGLVLHFIIAYAFAIAYFIAYPKIPLLEKNVWISGLLYGLLIWLFMNLIVLPNSNTPKSPMDVVSVLEIIWHMALVGLPMALIAEIYYSKETQK